MSLVSSSSLSALFDLLVEFLSYSHSHTQTVTQDSFYASADRARADRTRVLQGEYRSRAEVVAAFQKKMEDLMKEFVGALEKVDAMR